MSLRRSLLTRWHPYMDESLEILETSPDALPSDKTLVQWVKLAHLGEEVLFQFSMDDPVTNVDITDPKSQYALKGFERRLAEWRKEVPPECYSRKSFSLYPSASVSTTFCTYVKLYEIYHFSFFFGFFPFNIK